MTENSRGLSITLEPWDTTDEKLDLIQNYTCDHLSPFIVTALVHGSCATGEVIAYSDFDGVLIVKDSVIQDHRANKRFQIKTQGSMRYMRHFDPLQHHGWLVLTESQLKKFPVDIFPLELLPFTKCIYGENELNIIVNKTVNYKSGFDRFIIALLKNLELAKYNSNLYRLKGFLSELMLLPAVYYQTLHREGIYKKYSFERVKSDFNGDDWFAIDTATQIRSIWHYKMSGVQRLLSTQTRPILRKIYKVVGAPSIPADIKELLTDQFHESAKELALKMKMNIDEVYVNR